MSNSHYKDTYPHLAEKVVLSVDDSEMNQFVITKIMENAGIKTITVSNGAEALEKLQQGLKPDFILMDLEMPVMNGLETSENIKKNIDDQIPIIVNSGCVSPGQKWRLKRLGINDFLEKPYSLNDIFSTLSKYVEVYSA